MTTNGIAMAEEQQMEQEFQTEEGSRDADEPMETENRTDNFDKYLGMGFPEKVAAELDKFLVKEILQDDELDERALEALKELDETSSLGVLKQFSESDLSHVNNKSAFLCGVIKAYRQKSRLKQGTPSTTETTSKGPDEAKVKEILERTGYSLDVTTGQRKYGGPPPNWEGEPPVSGSEVFMGKIPRDLFEDSLIPLVEKCGTVYDLRLMMDPISGQNRGYAFVTFTDREGAKEAVKQLNGHKIKDGWQINVNISIPKSRLYIGSIPKTKSKEEIKEEFDKHTSGLMDVIIYHSEDKKKNRGFAFLEYDSHKSASLARRKMMSGRIKIWNNIAVNVDWADPIVEPDNDTMDKVKVVYIRNLTVDATEEKIKEHFTQYGAVERVKKMKDYCFVHFNERECALKAIEETHEKEYEGSTIEVSLAKPPQDNKEKKKRQMRGGFGGGFEYGGQGFSPRGRGGMMPQRGRGGFGGNRFQDYGGYGMDDYYYGGDYGGGYGDYYDEFGYDRGYGYGGYGGGPRGRGGMRGGRGGPRGGGMRGGPRGGGMRGGPRGGGMRGAPRGGRGGQRGGRGGRGGNIGGKRKFEGSQQMDTKRRNTQGGQWGAQPIAQQPLDQQSYGYDYNSGYGKDSWSSDNYGSGWN